LATTFAAVIFLDCTTVMNRSEFKDPSAMLDTKISGFFLLGRIVGRMVTFAADKAMKLNFWVLWILWIVGLLMLHSPAAWAVCLAAVNWFAFKFAYRSHQIGFDKPTLSAAAD